MRYNENAPAGHLTSLRGLTRSSDSTREGLGMKPTRKPRTKRYPLTPDLLTDALVARFADKVSATPGGCHEWTGARSTNGYGHLWVNPLRTTIKAHRIAYVLATGLTLSPADDLDHLCRNRACVNPGHLEPVGRKENLARGAGPNAESLRSQLDRDECQRGHDLTAPNAWRSLKGGRSRMCRLCSNEWARQARRAS